MLHVFRYDTDTLCVSMDDAFVNELMTELRRDGVGHGALSELFTKLSEEVEC